MAEESKEKKPLTKKQKIIIGAVAGTLAVGAAVATVVIIRNKKAGESTESK